MKQTWVRRTVPVGVGPPESDRGTRMDKASSTVRCPHCGAENPRSLLVTMCQECRGDLSTGKVEPPAPAGPAGTGPRVPVEPPAPAAPVPERAERAPRRPVLPPIPEEPPRPGALPDERVRRPPVYELKPIPPPLRGPSDKPYRGPSESQAVGILICLFAIVMFGIGFALLLWLTD